jgi:putative ABC transport system permease protein
MTFKGEIGGGRARRQPFGLVAQVVMSLVLLFVAGSVLQALLRLQAAPPGFDVGTRLYAYTFLPSSSSADDGRRAFYAQALESVRALPGIRAAAITSSLLTPLGSSCAALPGGPGTAVTVSDVDGDYFDIMGIELIAGRSFSAVDVSGDGAAVILNESLARRIWPEGRGLGERLTIGCDATQSAVVVGVVGDSVVAALNEPGQPHLYRAFAPQLARGFAAIVMQTNGDSAAVVHSVRRTLLAMGRGIRIYAVAPLAAHVDHRYAPLRWLARMLTGFGVLALVLAAVGLYGVIAYRVARRTQEIGVRMALGANRTDVFREVLTHGLAIVSVGVAIGEVLTMALTGVAGSLQEGIAPTGVSTHVAVALIWTVVALGACYVPAARAARVDPMVALRHD